jgi:hypothetical protein
LEHEIVSLLRSKKGKRVIGTVPYAMAALYAKFFGNTPGFLILVNGNRVMSTFFLATAAKGTFIEITGNFSIVVSVLPVMPFMVPRMHPMNVSMMEFMISHIALLNGKSSINNWTYVMAHYTLLFIIYTIL